MRLNIAQNSALNGIAGLSSTIGGFLSTVIVARLLGLEGTGVFAFAAWMIGLAVILVDLGIPGALARFIPELSAQGKTDEAAVLASTAFKLFVSMAAIVSAAFVVYGLFLSLGAPIVSFNIRGDRFTQQPLFWILLGPTCLGQSAFAYVVGYYRGMQNFAGLARLTTIVAVIQVTTTFIFGYFLGVAGALVGMILGNAAVLFVLPGLHKGRGEVVPELRSRVFKFAWQSWFFIFVSSFAWTRMEVFFLQRSFGPEAVSLFSVSLTLANIATYVPIFLAGVLVPYLASVSHLDEEAKEGYRIGLRLIAFAIFPACLGLAAIAPSLLPLLYGAEFSDASPIAMVLILSAAFATTSVVALSYLTVMERTDFVLLTGMLGAVLSILAGFTVIPEFGPMAAAYSRAAIQIVISGLMIWFIAFKLECSTPFAALARTFLAAMVCAGAAALTLWFISGALALLLAIPMGILAYVLAVRLLRALDQKDAERLLIATAILPQPIQPLARATLRAMSS